MTPLTDTENRQGRGFDVAALDGTDRALLGGCIVVWLAALGAGVAATVALVDMGATRTSTATSSSGTPWILYTIIGVSAAVIVAAVPLLLRARRAADDELTPVEKRLAQQAAQRSQPVRTVEAPTEKLRVPPAPLDTNSGRLPRILQSPTIASPVADSPAVVRLWLRNTASVACAMGVATLLISAATYLMAIDNETVSWVLLGAAGVVTVAMGAIPWYFLRELRAELHG